ncbi:MAG: M56 family metallopeptidase [Phycisphaerae bacterium]|nr:M56 family metallopeptidase [Phycisphaerae bacterium]
MRNFIETLNTLGEWLVENLRLLSVELLILAGIVVAILFLLRVRSPRVRHMFWLLVLAKPVVTLLIASPISLYWFLQPEAPAPPPPVRTTIVAPQAAPMQPPSREHAPRPYRRPMTAVSAAPAEVKEPSAWASINLYGIVAMSWLVIASALGLRLLVGYVYVTFLRKTAEVQPCDSPLGEAVLDAAKRLNMRPRARLALSGVSHAPVLAGILRPLILLPRALPKQLPPEQVRLVIAHELTHVRRWDNLVLLLQRIAEMLLFFHPVVWLCGWVMRREAENACDDAVLKAYDLSVEYAESLTRVAETHHNLARRLLVNTFAAAESNLSRRVRRILTARPSRTTLILSISAVVALVLLGCLGLPTTAERKENKQEQPSYSTKGKHPVKIDYSNLRLKGNHETQDAFSLVVQAAAKLYGLDVDYETLYALSTNAFAPDIRLDEPTKCHWQVQGRGRCLDLVARRIGLNIRMLPQPDHSKDPSAPKDSTKREVWLREYWRKPFIKPVRDALAAGEIIITDREWDPRDAFWCDWGIILEAREDGTFLGITTNGKKNNRMSHIGPSVPVLSQGKSTLSAHEADLEMLRLAAYRIRGQERFAPGPEGKGIIFGLAAMDAWIHQMNSVPYDTEQWQGNDRSADQAKKTALPTYEGAKVAAAHLRKQVNTFAEGARPHLEAAAKHYDRIVKLLDPAINSRGDENYDRFMGDLDKQKAHIERVLKPVKSEFAAAADEMEQALVAEGVKVPKPATASDGADTMSNTTDITSTESTAKNVRRENGKVWIEGVEPLVVKEDRRSSFFVAMKAVLCAMGEETTYDELLGMSAYAFRVQFYEKKFWCDSAPCPVCGADSAGAALAAFGYEETTYMAEESAPEEVSKARKAVMASIDAGRPVIGLVSHEQGKIDWGLIVGYQNDGKQFLCRGSDNATNVYPPSLTWPWLTIVLERKDNPPARKESTIASLKQALVQTTTPKYGDYFSGSAAYECWMDALGKDDAIRSMSPKDLGAACEGNKLHALLLLDSRLAAARYLRSIAGNFSGDTSKHLLTAAKYYHDAAKILEDSQRQTPPLWASNIEWTSERRNAQIKVLRAVADFDSRANVEIEQALAAEESDRK